ncbi:hypothetical protein [Microbacterium dauci]|uniref:Uncharacterized protein n=1 Tax=Microbacterium dauci TaxID=3048008 RepID=A0ABT6ZCU2_9MICO|nr:hypothetical protein [Microbacterium sp. LX3-4]MDJ1113980.1 hypothetical protein [Microbacterium sp. LX3-4]
MSARRAPRRPATGSEPWAALDAMMRSALGAHLAGLLAAAAIPLTLIDLERLAGRPRVARTLPAATIHGIRVDAAGFALDGADALGRVVRNLHVGPLAPGKELSARTQERALAPFRAALLSAAAAAHASGEWDRAAPVLSSAAFARSMHHRNGERDALVTLLTDPGRARLLAVHDPAEPGRQRHDAAAHLARAARTPEDLVPLAALLVADDSLEESPGAVPRRLPPVYALLGDGERAVLLAERVRTEPEIELAYVAQALAQAGDPGAMDIALRAVAAHERAATGALLRTAHAVAGCALHTADPSDAHRLAQLARVLVRRAAVSPQVHAVVAGLRQQLFRAARDHERGIGATAAATAAAALGRIGDADAAVQAANDAQSLCDSIEGAAQRAVAAAAVAARLRVVASDVLEPIADAVAELALASAAAPAQLAEVARLLSGETVLDGDWTDPPAVPDRARVAAAAERILVAAHATPVDRHPQTALTRGALTVAVNALPAGDPRTVAAVHAVVDGIREMRYPSSLERRARARTDAVVLAEAAVAFAGFGDLEASTTTAALAVDVCGRVPVAARARPLADVVATLLPARDPATFDVATRAWAAVTAPLCPWDADAALAVASAAAATARTAEHLRADALRAMRDHAELLLRRHGDAASLTLLADRAARAGEDVHARTLAEAALRAAGVADPLRRRLAAVALAAGADATAEPPVVSAVARQWLTDGVPAAGLPALAAHEPKTAARVAALLRTLVD